MVRAEGRIGLWATAGWLGHKGSYRLTSVGHLDAVRQSGTPVPSAVNGRAKVSPSGLRERGDSVRGFCYEIAAKWTSTITIFGAARFQALLNSMARMRPPALDRHTVTAESASLAPCCGPTATSRAPAFSQGPSRRRPSTPRRVLSSSRRSSRCCCRPCRAGWSS
jgi:hypothetical protein